MTSGYQLGACLLLDRSTNDTSGRFILRWHDEHADFPQCGDDECMHSIDRSLQDEQRSRQQDLLKKTQHFKYLSHDFFFKKIFAIHAVDYSSLRGLKSDYIIEIKDRLS